MSCAQCTHQAARQLSSVSLVRLTVTAAVLFTATITATAAAAEPVSLKWTFVKGSRIQCQTTQDVTTIIRAGKNRKKQNARYTFDTSWKIVRAEKNDIEAQVKIDRFRLHVQRPSGVADLSYDSMDAAGDRGASTVLSEVVGTEFLLRF